MGTTPAPSSAPAVGPLAAARLSGHILGASAGVFAVDAVVSPRTNVSLELPLLMRGVAAGQARVLHHRPSRKLAGFGLARLVKPRVKKAAFSLRGTELGLRRIRPTGYGHGTPAERNLSLAAAGSP
jgi:hypothetical protein